MLESDQIRTINDAQVELLIDDNASEQLVHAKDGQYISSSTKVIPGKKYELRVSHSGYQQVSASTIVPAQANAQLIAAEIVTVRTDEYTTERARFKVNLSDVKGDDYYRLMVYVPGYNYNYETGEYNFDGNTFYPVEINSTDPVLNGNVVAVDDDFSDYPPNQFHVFNDELFDGKEHQLVFEIDHNNAEDLPKIKVDLQKITYDLYMYYKTLDAYYYYEDNPFSEPVRIHVNVKNGAGIVGSCTSNWLTVKE